MKQKTEVTMTVQLQLVDLNVLVDGQTQEIEYLGIEIPCRFLDTEKLKEWADQNGFTASFQHAIVSHAAECAQQQMLLNLIV